MISRSKMISINDAADYILHRLDNYTRTTKLHGLLYLCQAWHLVVEDVPLFDGKFQARVFGPIHQPLVKQHATLVKATKSLEELDFANKAKKHIDEVLQAYKSFDSGQLTHFFQSDDEAYKFARRGMPPEASCDVEIREDIMQIWYSWLSDRLEQEGVVRKHIEEIGALLENQDNFKDQDDQETQK